jgi:hypothetical protein
MSGDEPTDEELRLVVRHGNGNFTRALAVTKLAKRQGRFDELCDLVEGEGGV